MHNPPTRGTWGNRGLYVSPMRKQREERSALNIMLSTTLAVVLCAAAAVGGFHLFTLLTG